MVCENLRSEIGLLCFEQVDTAIKTQDQELGRILRDDSALEVSTKSVCVQRPYSFRKLAAKCSASLPTDGVTFWAQIQS